MNMKLHKEPTITFYLEGKEIDLSFVSAPQDYIIQQNDENAVVHLRKNVTAEIKQYSNIISIDINKSISFSVSFAIQIKNFKLEKLSDFRLLIDDNYVLEVDHGQLDFNNQNVILVKLFNEDTSIKIKKYSKTFEALSTDSDFTMFVSPSGLPTIGFGVREPEFSIGIYDYYNSSESIESSSSFKFPRLIRNGVPIISTVPSQTDVNISLAAKESYTSGLGEEKKTLYFKIICNSLIEPSLTVGLTSRCQLKVYNPGGLDIVKAAEYVPMILRYTSATKNIQVYSAEYTFYKSGIHNDVEYVDGYMYFDVYAPVSVQRDIPFQFNFTPIS
jgi:hypothetical protein